MKPNLPSSLPHADRTRSPKASEIPSPAAMQDSMPADFRPARNASPASIVCDPSEAGIKLIGILGRHLENLSPSMFHKWIRTGQVRVNGSRAQAFDRVDSGDVIRIPPFAFDMDAEASTTVQAKRSPRQGEKSSADAPRNMRSMQDVGSATRAWKDAKHPRGAGNKEAVSTSYGHTYPKAGGIPRDRNASAPMQIEIIGEKDGILAVFKPSGIPTHPGTNHGLALTDGLAALANGAPFPPTPAHRLDRDTSGVLLAARTFKALREAQDLFRDHSSLSKEYLCWVDGLWPHDKETILRHWLAKKGPRGKERMVASTVPGDGQEAVLACRPLSQCNGRTLLLVRIFTGRTHQIRCQLAAMGFPITGDGKYGKPMEGTGMFLHALRLTLPDGTVFAALPRWKGMFSVEEMPASIRTTPR